eukprot:scaffold32288_cov18-Prasinocladus_malaysianus.AAC.2
MEFIGSIPCHQKDLVTLLSSMPAEKAACARLATRLIDETNGMQYTAMQWHFRLWLRSNMLAGWLSLLRVFLHSSMTRAAMIIINEMDVRVQASQRRAVLLQGMVDISRASV